MQRASTRRLLGLTGAGGQVLAHATEVTKEYKADVTSPG
jgi:hypothetical protein